MPRVSTQVWLGLLVVAGLLLVSDSATPTKPKTAVLVGDSIAVGLAPTLQKLFSERGVNLTVKAKSGTSIRDWKTLDTTPYDLVLLSFGSNDVLTDFASEEQDLQKLASGKARWIVPPVFYNRDSEKDKEFATMMMRSAVLIQTNEPFPDVSSDPARLHLTVNGYKRYAEQIVKALGL